ncbi:MAG: glycosyltransferase family 2 protein [Acidimicrobiales bacterium]
MTPTADPADVAVVIVNFRTPTLTLAAVRSVAAEPEIAEIVVVDNASGDGSADLLRSHLAAEPRARLVASPANVGFGRGLNLGAASCRAPLLLVLNSDAALVAGSLAPLRRALMDDESVGIVAPAVYTGDGRELQAAAHGVFPTLGAIARRTNHNPPETLWPDWVSGVAMLVRRGDFEAVGGFDPDFSMYLEDVDLCRRVRAAGKSVRRELAAGVTHLGGQSWQAADPPFDEAQRSRVVYYRKAGYPAVARLAVRAIRLAHLAVARLRRRPGAMAGGDTEGTAQRVSG